MPILLTWLVHDIKSAIVVVDIGVTATAINMILHAGVLPVKVRYCGLFRSLGAAELPVARLVLVYRKHC